VRALFFAEDRVVRKLRFDPGADETLRFAIRRGDE
jgi:hypothetical protein